MSDLANRTAVLTGGTGALGSVVTLALARAGVRCHVTYVVEQERAGLENSCGPLTDRIAFHKVDVTDADAVEGFYASLDRSGAILDILVNIAGGFDMGPVESTPVEAWDRLMNLNARSVFLNCRQAVVRMKPRKTGRIITVSARAALETPGLMSVYVASKAAVLTFTQSLAQELKDDGITVNAILPSVIDTPANRKAMPQGDFAAWVTPGQIADAILFLVRDQASAISGAALPLYARA